MLRRVFNVRFLILSLILSFGLSLGLPTSRVAFADDFPHGPDSQRQPSVPRGEVIEGHFVSKEGFPGTHRRYSIYVPDQYDGQPAALMVFQDGHAFVKETGDFRVPVVFDNLIAAGEMPVTIAVMVDPGNRGPLPDSRGWNRGTNNRSVEYDTVSDQYANFLVDEFLPAVLEPYQISDDPDQHAIAGNSSGGIAAFGVAWHRPDAFRKVLSHIGSFVNIRGGHAYPSMIRKQKKRPLRVLLQDGAGDLDNQHGNWPLANQQMAKALAFRDYDYRFIYGTGAHNGKEAGSIFPDSLRWLWRD